MCEIFGYTDRLEGVIFGDQGNLPISTQSPLNRTPPAVVEVRMRTLDHDTPSFALFVTSDEKLQLRYLYKY